MPDELPYAQISHLEAWKGEIKTDIEAMKRLHVDSEHRDGLYKSQFETHLMAIKQRVTILICAVGILSITVVILICRS